MLLSDSPGEYGEGNLLQNNLIHRRTANGVYHQGLFNRD